jgi:m7GpppX diphosphatase
MQFSTDNNESKFIPSKILSIDDINKKHIFNNDIFNKYKTTAVVEGELIVTDKNVNLNTHRKKIVKEKYKDYLKNIEKHDKNIDKDKWIYNIINNISEQDKILYRDDKCIVFPSYIWDSKNLEKLRILCIPIDTSLRCIRSLEFKHVSLLKHMKKVTCAVIKEKYGIDECYLKKFFHYEPSTYHLHIHFAIISDKEVNSSVEYSHDLDTVIFNLFICNNYYKRIHLNKVS